MQNPLEQPAPEDKLEQVHAFALDYVYGVANGMWGMPVNVDNGNQWTHWEQLENNFTIYLQTKWNRNPPSIELLEVFSYFIANKIEEFSKNYIPTEKAFALLTSPIKTPTVFISYGHKQSSALALLIEARLKYVDNQIGVFIDKSITPGDEWHAHLQEQVEASQYLVCLLGQSLIQDSDGNPQLKPSIDSPYIRQEIQWALQAKKTVITICHSGYRFPGEQGELDAETWTLMKTLRDKQGIFVDAESAEEYEFAVNKLLNAMG